MKNNYEDLDKRLAKLTIQNNKTTTTGFSSPITFPTGVTSNVLQEQVPAQTIGLYEINSTKDYCMFRLVITSLEAGNEIQILQFNLTGLYVKPAVNTLSSTGTSISTNNFLNNFINSLDSIHNIFFNIPEQNLSRISISSIHSGGRNIQTGSRMRVRK